jgi:Uncharacterized conserved protein, contains double-stranded beta-helix domain
MGVGVRGWTENALLRLCLAASIIGASGSAASAEVPRVVPLHEREGLEHHLPGAPTETQGVLSVRMLGSTDLEPDFPSMKGYVLRAREITVAPGGQIGVHRHESRPGVAVMLEGAMTERRAPGGRPEELAPGEVAFEGSEVIHWWRNETDLPAKAIVIDIVPAKNP